MTRLVRDTRSPLCCSLSRSPTQLPAPTGAIPSPRTLRLPQGKAVFKIRVCLLSFLTLRMTLILGGPGVGRWQVTSSTGPTGMSDTEHSLCLAFVPLPCGGHPQNLLSGVSPLVLPRSWTKLLAPTWWFLQFGNKNQGLAGLSASSEIVGGSVGVRNFDFHLEMLTCCDKCLIGANSGRFILKHCSWVPPTMVAKSWHGQLVSLYLWSGSRANRSRAGL